MNLEISVVLEKFFNLEKLQNSENFNYLKYTVDELNSFEIQDLVDKLESEDLNMKTSENFDQKNIENLMKILQKIEEPTTEQVKPFKSSKNSCMGGTFDHLHFGHKLFLSFAMLNTQKLLIGVTKDFMLTKKKYGYALETISKRKWNVN